MKQVVAFTKIRFIMFSLSLLLIIGGIAGTVSKGGFDLGIDFQAGLNQRVQIADPAMALKYNGSKNLDFNIISGNVSLRLSDRTSVSNVNISIEENKNLASLAAEIKKVSGVSVKLLVDGSVESSTLAALAHPITLSSEEAYINYIKADSEDYIQIDEIREVLKSIGNPQIQIVGKAESQEFVIRVEDSEGDKEFSSRISASITSLLEEKYGKGHVIVKQTDYVGPRFSQDLGQQTVFIILVTFALILVYIWFRFKLAYAVSSITALVHDILIMLGFIGTFQLEVSTGTIAAVLTIIGYSLNDTIVVFDRIRENTSIMKESKLSEVIDTSITQSLSRTIITSLTTLLAVLAIYIFATGQIKDFALNVIVGVVVGTYSSIFIASPVLLAWTNLAEKRKAKKASKENKKKK